MKILLLGPNGQVGWELQRALAPLGAVTALSRQGSGDLSGDLADPDSLATTVKTVAPDVIVNAAAYTAVDQAESEPDQARLINSQALARLITDHLTACKKDYLLPATGVYTQRQKFQRAFAQEFLCPFMALREFLGEGRIHFRTPGSFGGEFRDKTF